VTEEDLRERIERSYPIIRAAFQKKVQAGLGG
jgi:hypothetical protein